MQIMCIISYLTSVMLLHGTHRRMSVTIMLLNTRRAVCARLIMFACLAFPAAQRVLGSSVEKPSVHRRTATVGITINILSLIVFVAVLNTHFNCALVLLLH